LLVSPDQSKEMHHEIIKSYRQNGSCYHRTWVSTIPFQNMENNVNIFYEDKKNGRIKLTSNNDLSRSLVTFNIEVIYIEKQLECSSQKELSKLL
jgi:hypothetical protein